MGDADRTEGLRDTYRDPVSEEESGLGVRLLVLPWSLIPSIASNKRLFLGPISWFSSRTCRLISRGKIISQTLSSVSNESMNSSINVSEYPATNRVRKCKEDD